MSLATTLTALQNARGAIVDAISSKGVTIASSATLLSCASAIDDISAGTDVSSTTAQAGDVLSGKVFYNSGGSLTSGTIATVSASIESDSVIVPVGYIAVSQSFPVSGGIDVSDTTAEAENVQSGYYFYNSAGVKTAGTLTVSGGADVSDTTATAEMVLSGAIFHDSTGAVTTGTIPTVSAAIESGAVVVPSGYIASSQSFPVSSGADVILGYVSGGIFYELAFSGTSSVEVASSAGLSNYAWNLPASSGSSGGSITSGVAIDYYDDVVSSADSMTSKSLDFGYRMIVYSGGTASDTMVNYGGSMRISSGGAVNSTVISGGVMVVSNGGIANYTELDWNRTAATMRVFGTANNIVISSGVNFAGTLYVESDGITSNITVSSGGSLIVSSGGTALAVYRDPDAHIHVSNGGYIEYVNS